MNYEYALESIDYTDYTLGTLNSIVKYCRPGDNRFLGIIVRFYSV